MDNNSLVLNNQNTVSQFRLAGAGKRFVAAMVDGLIVFLPVVLICGSMFIAGGMLTEDSDTEGLGSMVIILSCCLYFLLALGLGFFIQAYWPSTHNGQSIGKKLIGIRIIDQYGKTPTLGILIGRFALHMFLANFISFIVYITIFFHEKKQAVYDLIINTYVVEA